MRQALMFLKKELLQVLYAPESLLLMLLFPLALTFVLGSAFSGHSAGNAELPKEEIPVVTEGAAPLAPFFVQYANQAGLALKRTDREALEPGQQYISISGTGIVHHTDEQRSVTAATVSMYSRIFSRQTALGLRAVRRGLPAQGAPSMDIVRVESIQGGDGPSSFGYYGVTMITMILMYGALQAVGLMAGETAGRTYLRLKASPVPMRRVFLLKALSASLALLMQLIVLLAANRWLYGVVYRSIPAVALLALPLVLFSCALGLMCYQLLRTEAGASALINILVVAMVFLGGGYMPLDDGALAGLVGLSPVGMVNQGIFSYIYRDSLAEGVHAALWCLGLAALMLSVAYALFLREEGSDRVAGR